MKVHFVESGGYLGLVKGCDLDTTTLTPESARELEKLVKSSGISTSGEFLSDVGRDLRLYEITIEDRNKKIKATFDDEKLPAPAKPLIAYLRKQALPMAP